VHKEQKVTVSQVFLNVTYSLFNNLHGMLRTTEM